MARIKDAEMEKRKRLVVNYFAEKTSSGRSYRATYSAIADDLGLSVKQLRCVISSLESQGAIRVTKRFSPLGAQIENAYRVTPYGKRLIRAQASEALA